MAEEKKSMELRDGVKVHLDKDPNDPRRAQLFNSAEPNLSNLNEEDPEVSPSFQNPVK
jgi:hypothetical protein